MKRKGIHELLDRCRDRTHHVQCALKEDFPLSLEDPLPSETIRDVEFTRSTADGEICKVCDFQLHAAEELVRTRASAQTKWNARILGSIAAAAGRFQTVAAKQLLRQLNIGGDAWVGQFAYGFPITGTLSQKLLYPSGRGRAARLPAEEIPDSPSARIRGRAAKSGMENAVPLWNEAMEQAKEGWPLDPIPLSEDGRPMRWCSRRFNVSFRLGVPQADKLRACDDMIRSIPNLACAVETPIQLLSRDNIAHISSMLAAGGGDWVMFKADRKGA